MKQLYKSIFNEHALAFIATLLSILGCLLFLRLYLTQTSRQFAEDFTNQNLSALAAADSYQLAARLSSLSSSVHWVCIPAKRGKVVFYSRSKSNSCGESFFQAIADVTSKSDDPLSVRFTLTLPASLKWGALGFAFLQLFLLWSLFLTGRRAALRAERIKREGTVQLAYLAAQVAHDIRSPLTALSMVESDLSALPEDTRLMMRLSINRVQDIANQLIEKYRATLPGYIAPLGCLLSNGEGPCEAQLLLPIVESIVTEKRMQYRSKLDVVIECRWTSASYGIFASFQPAEFKRVISNIINNSVESLPGPGRVYLTLGQKSGYLQLQISDNGRGISPEVVSVLAQPGESHGKVGGAGLGLFHARTALRTWGGALSIKSAVGKGTQVVLELPLSASPSWFLRKVELTPKTTIVVLDDDQSIHKIWAMRPEVQRAMQHGSELLHFLKPAELEFWFRIQKSKNGTNSDRVVYLVDFEFVGSDKNGLEIIESLGIKNGSILVTSRYEEKEVLDRCQQLGVPLLPKGMAGLVPIEFSVD